MTREDYKKAPSHYFTPTFITHVPHRKGMAGIPWYDSQSVLYHLRGYSLERPMIMAYAEGTRKFFRPISMPTTQAVKKWMRYFAYPQKHPHVYQSCLTFDFSVLERLAPALPNAALKPPPLRSKKEQQEYQTYIEEFKKWKDEVWNETLDQEGFCTGRDLVWDIDDCYGDMDALTASAKVAELLKTKYGVEFVEIDYSGSKGFHVVVPWEHAKAVLNMTEKDLYPLQTCAKRTWGIVKRIFREATGEEFREADLSPMRRQGIRRCPFSVHPKTMRVSLPLAKGHVLRNGVKVFDPDKFHFKVCRFPKTPLNYQTPNALDWTGELLLLTADLPSA